jgi:hypothetical protein
MQQYALEVSFGRRTEEVGANEETEALEGGIVGEEQGCSGCGFNYLRLTGGEDRGEEGGEVESRESS